LNKLTFKRHRNINKFLLGFHQKDEKWQSFLKDPGHKRESFLQRPWHSKIGYGVFLDRVKSCEKEESGIARLT